jgi:hypothetical protein
MSRRRAEDRLMAFLEESRDRFLHVGAIARWAQISRETARKYLHQLDAAGKLETGPAEPDETDRRRTGTIGYRLRPEEQETVMAETETRSFPDRPDHPDFWLLSRSVRDLDGQAGTVPLPDLIGRLLDPQSVLYMARQRAALIRTRGAGSPADTRYAAAWIEGLIVGMTVQHLKEIPDADSEGEDPA